MTGSEVTDWGALSAGTTLLRDDGRGRGGGGGGGGGGGRAVMLF